MIIRELNDPISTSFNIVLIIFILIIYEQNSVYLFYNFGVDNENFTTNILYWQNYICIVKILSKLRELYNTLMSFFYELDKYPIFASLLYILKYL